MALILTSRVGTPLRGPRRRQSRGAGRCQKRPARGLQHLIAQAAFNWCASARASKVSTSRLASCRSCGGSAAAPAAAPTPSRGRGLVADDASDRSPWPARPRRAPTSAPDLAYGGTVRVPDLGRRALPRPADASLLVSGCRGTGNRLAGGLPSARKSSASPLPPLAPCMPLPGEPVPNRQKTVRTLCRRS